MRYKRVRIPEDATLKEVIAVFNMMRLEIDVENPEPEVHKFIYEHQEWFEEPFR